MTTTARLLLFALVAGLSFAACTDAGLIPVSHPTTLTGTVWRVVAVNGRPPAGGNEPTVAFAAAEVKGSAGCNSYGGSYQYDPSSGAIEFRDIAMTAMACVEPGKMVIEALFTQAFNQARTASLDPQGRLVLSGPGGEIVLAVAAVPS